MSSSPSIRTSAAAVSPLWWIAPWPAHMALNSAEPLAAARRFAAS